MPYKKPTLTETYAELHLAPDTLTESRFFEVVPKLKELGFSEVEFATVGLSLDIKQGRPSPRQVQRVRCWKPGRTELVQVGEDLLICNLTGQYPGWDAFVTLFHISLGALRAGLGTPDIQSLNLTTIDTFQVPKEGFTLGEYLAVGGRILSNWYEGCRQSLDLDMGHGLLESDGQNRQVHVSARAVDDPVQVTIRAQFHDKVQRLGDLEALLSQLHAESNQTFEDLITDRLRNEVMGGRAD